MTARLAASGIGAQIGGRWLVQDVSLEVPGGELLVVVGPNGAGKTTLMRLLTGELRPSEGRLALCGEEPGRTPAWRLAARRAVMAQATRLAFPFCAAEVVSIGLEGIGRALGASARHAIVARSLAAADVEHLAGRAYQTLSGGEMQRVQFARALAQLEAGRSIEPDQILFLDEPVSSLDLAHQLALMQRAANLARQGLAVVAVLHDLNLAATFADRILVMRQGRCAGLGAPREIITPALLADVFDLSLRSVPGPAADFAVLPSLLEPARGNAGLRSAAGPG